MTENELAVERVVAKTTTVVGFTRKPRERKIFLEHLLRVHVVIDAPKPLRDKGADEIVPVGAVDLTPAEENDDEE